MRLALGFVFLAFVQCSSPIPVDDDSGIPDSGKPDQSVADSGKMDSGKMDASMDSSMMDSSNDAEMDSSMSDASDGGQPDVVIISDGGFDPGMLNGLALWLDAAKGVTKNNQNQVSKWADQSSNKNDASQGSSSLQPVWKSSSINALPALHFDMNDFQVLSIADAASLQWGTGDYLVEVVAGFDNDGTNGEYGTFFGKVGQSSGVIFIANDPMGMGNGLAGAIDQSNFIGASKSYSDSVARSYGFRRTGSTLELRANGQQIASQNQVGNVDVSATNQPVYIGDIQQQLPLDGDIAEVVAVKGSISNQDLAALEAYFKSKYNL